MAFPRELGEDEVDLMASLRQFITQHIYLLAVAIGLVIGLGVALDPVTAGMGFLGLVVLALSIRYPGFILSALLGLMLFQRFQMIRFGVFNVPLSLAKLAALVAIVVCVGQAMIKRQRLVVFDRVSLGLLAVVLAYLVSTLAADDPVLARRRMMSILLLTTLTYFSYRFVTRAQFQFVLEVLPFLLLVMCGMSFWDLYNGGVWSRAIEITSRANVVRGGGSFGDPNVWSSVNLFFIPLMLHYIRQAKYIWQKPLGLVVITGLVLNIGMSFSRAGYLVLGLLLLLVAWQLRRRPLLLVVGALAVVAAFAVTVPLDVVEQRFSRLFAVSAAGNITSASISSRYKVLTGGFEVFLSNPLFGVGPEHYGKYVSYGTIADFGKASHNIYMQILVELGAVGIVAFMLLWSGVVNIYRRMQRSLTEPSSQSLLKALFLSFFAYAAMGATLNILYHSYMWFVLGLGLSVIRWEEEVVEIPTGRPETDLLERFHGGSRLITHPQS